MITCPDCAAFFRTLAEMTAHRCVRPVSPYSVADRFIVLVHGVGVTRTKLNDRRVRLHGELVEDAAFARVATDTACAILRIDRSITIVDPLTIDVELL